MRVIIINKEKMMIIFLFTAWLVIAAVNHSAFAANEFIYPKCSEVMHQYFQQRYLITICSPIFSFLAMLALLQAGFVGRLRDSFNKITAYSIRLLLTILAIYLLGCLIRLPFNFYSSYSIEHNFGLSNQSFADWAKDQFNYLLIGTLVVPIVAICFALIRRFQRHWFIPVWLLISTSIVFTAFIEPLAFEPVFNKFHPLPNSHLRDSINRMCRNAGIPQVEILVSNKSKQTTKINAYVNGFASTKRIVLYDNLVNEVPESQILAIVAHELGHYVLRHVLTGLAICVFSLVPALYFSQLFIDKYLVRLPKKWGIKSSSDPAFFAVICMALWILPLCIAPIPSYISRLLESEADAYSIRLTQSPIAAAEAFRTLSAKNISDPDPPAFIEFWFFSHPSIKHRIDYALSQLNTAKEN